MALKYSPTSFAAAFKGKAIHYRSGQALRVTGV